jgi:hypothetical protein
LIDRDASGVRLAVDRVGTALVTYRARGRLWHVVAWGAVNARPSSRTRPQVAFRLDYSGRRGRVPLWETFANRCRPYDGPRLPWLLTACKAPDGSYWALQRWQRMLPNLGYQPWLRDQAVRELRLSHWSGPLAQLEVWTDWIYSGRYHGLFGRLTYRGAPVHGFRSSSSGVPLDTYGRNLYLDTLASAYAPGWRRENSFLAHTGTGVFCYGFFPRAPYPGYPAQPSGLRPAGHGRRYRMTVIGPGVTPDVTWQGTGLPVFDPGNGDHLEWQTEARRIRADVARDDRLCRG